MKNIPEQPSSPIAQCIFRYKEEAEYARRNRIVQNRENYDVYHMRQDYTHKRKGQSQEFLSKQQMAVESITTFLQQGLMDLGQWFRVEENYPMPDALLTVEEIQKLIERQLDKNDFPSFMSDDLKTGLLASLMIVKVGGKEVTKSEFEARQTDSADFSKKLIRKDKKYWQLDLNLIRPEDYFPDPTGRNLYKVERVTMDYHDLEKLAKANPDDFDLEQVERVQSSWDELQKARRASETGQNQTYSDARKRIEIFECWGTFLDPTGKVLHENSVAAISVTGEVIRPPKPYPDWSGEDPYVVSPIIRVPFSVWHRALMDSGTKHNRAMNELYNLMLDAGVMSVFGIKELRYDWLEKPEQVADGIPPGETLLINSSAPPGVSALTRTDTGALSREAIEMFNLIDREFNQSALTNDTRLGAIPERNVKATEIVASNQSLAGIFQGIAKIIEQEHVTEIVRKSWLKIAQNANDLDTKEVENLLGPERSKKIAAMSNEDIFAATAANYKYKVFGLSRTLNKIQDFRKYTALLQTVGTSPELMARFQEKYSITKFLGEIVKGLDIDAQKIEIGEDEKAKIAQEKQQMQQMEMMKNGMGGEAPNMQSQIPQAASTQPEVSPMQEFKAQMNQGLTTP